MDEHLLLIPGPTNISKRVRDAMAGPQIGHTSTEFYNDFKEILSMARYTFGNQKGFQFVFSGSGTIGMETAVLNLVARGERTLVVKTGYFGKRMLMLNQIHGAKADVLEYPEGSPADPDDLRKKLKENTYRAVFVTHVDTSTSVVNPVNDLVAECSDAGTFSVVDSVCGLAGMPLDFDRMGADIAFTASQKAIAGPPGAVLIATSQAALEHIQKRGESIETYYMNLNRWKPVMDDPKMYLATPSVQVLLALREALSEVKEEGLEKRWARHAKLGETVRSHLSALGLDLVAREDCRSNTVTSFWVPEGKSAPVQKALEERYGIAVARGIQEHKEKMIRMGHFGIISVERLEKAMTQVDSVLTDLGLAKQHPQIAGR